MSTHGTIGPFEQGREDWTSYTERLEQYFAANGVEDAGKQHAILLSVCGSSLLSGNKESGNSGQANRPFVQGNCHSCQRTLLPATIGNRATVHVQHEVTERRRNDRGVRSRSLSNFGTLPVRRHLGRHATRQSCVWNQRRTYPTETTCRIGINVQESV